MTAAVFLPGYAVAFVGHGGRTVAGEIVRLEQGERATVRASHFVDSNGERVGPALDFRVRLKLSELRERD